MPLHALILSQDPHAISVVRDAMVRSGISLTVAGTDQDALHEISFQKFEAVVVDCASLPGAAAVLRRMRKGPSNRNAIGLVLVESGCGHQEAFHDGANFVLEAPFTLERVTRTIRAAHGLMVRERREYFRYLLDVPVTATLSNGTAFTGRALNISESGIALKLSQPGTLRGQVSVTFTFPASERETKIYGDVAWMNEAGEAGVRFTRPSRSAKAALHRWIRDQRESAQG